MYFNFCYALKAGVVLRGGDSLFCLWPPNTVSDSHIVRKICELHCPAVMSTCSYQSLCSSVSKLIQVPHTTLRFGSCSLCICSQSLKFTASQRLLPRDASAERGNATASRPSDCLSVCLSVTFRYQQHIGWNSSKIISRSNSLGPLLWLRPNMGDLVQRQHPQNQG